MDKSIELRKVPIGNLYKLVSILETCNDWTKLMMNIPKYLDSDKFEPKYNTYHIRLIEEASIKYRRKCSEILFDEWGTSGKIRPTLKHLKDILIFSELYRAADELSNLLNEPVPERPKKGPAASVDIDQLLAEVKIENDLKNLATVTNVDNINDVTHNNNLQSNEYNNDITNDKMKDYIHNLERSKTPGSNLIQFSKILEEHELPNIESLINHEPSTSNTNNEVIGYQQSLPNINSAVDTSSSLDSNSTEYMD